MSILGSAQWGTTWEKDFRERYSDLFLPSQTQSSANIVRSYLSNTHVSPETPTPKPKPKNSGKLPREPFTLTMTELVERIPDNYWCAGLGLRLDQIDVSRAAGILRTLVWGSVEWWIEIIALTFEREYIAYDKEQTKEEWIYGEWVRIREFIPTLSGYRQWREGDRGKDCSSSYSEFLNSVRAPPEKEYAPLDRGLIFGIAGFLKEYLEKSGVRLASMELETGSQRMGVGMEGIIPSSLAEVKRETLQKYCDKYCGENCEKGRQAVGVNWRGRESTRQKQLDTRSRVIEAVRRWENKEERQQNGGESQPHLEEESIEHKEQERERQEDLEEEGFVKVDKWALGADGAEKGTEELRNTIRKRNVCWRTLQETRISIASATASDCNCQSPACPRILTHLQKQELEKLQDLYEEMKLENQQQVGYASDLVENYRRHHIPNNCPEEYARCGDVLSKVFDEEL